MKNLSKVSLVVLSVFVFGVASASDDPWAKLVEDYKSGKLSSWQVVKKDSSAAQSQNVVKGTLSKGKEKAEEVFASAKGTAEDVKNKVKDAVSDSDEKKGGLFGFFRGNKANEASSSKTDNVEDDVKNLGEKAEDEVKNTSNEVEDNVKEISDDVEENIDEAAGDVDDAESEVEDEADEVVNGENKSKPGFFKRLFGNRSEEEDTLADSSESEYDDSESEIDDDDAETEHDASESNEEDAASHLLDEDEVNEAEE